MTYSDPYVHAIELDGTRLQSQSLDDAVAAADCVVIVTDHSSFEYAGMVRKASLIVDTRNALKGFSSANIVRL